ncbi:MAG: helix-turn-helix transcriptional regulator [Ilumatobacter sp.]|uniref:helix-turn-helix transcriptional regulator n=1 Tax=Ilumatobacter sp. TaxID=1967498 RepID=UPI00391D8A9E
MNSPIRLDVLKALGDNTRYAIYLELARATRPLATSDIADALGLHSNTVRPHLERMREVGLLEVQVGGRGDVGRPQHRYSIASDAPALGLEPPTMPVLASMVLSMAKRLQASTDDAVAVGRDEGRSRARMYSQAPSTLEALVSDLDRLGFDPLVTDAPPLIDPDAHDDLIDDDASAIVAFANCPFAELAREHPDLVCGLHQGLVAGFVAGMGDADAHDFCTLTSRTPCQVTVSAR